MHAFNNAKDGIDVWNSAWDCHMYMYILKYSCTIIHMCKHVFATRMSCMWFVLFPETCKRAKPLYKSLSKPVCKPLLGGGLKTVSNQFRICCYMQTIYV